MNRFDNDPRVVTPAVLLRPARALWLVFFVTAAVLLFVPWQQTAPGGGAVVPYSPEDREQGVDAPVTGRVAQWFVREGDRVKAGDALVELVDIDPEYVSRLDQKRGALETQIDATEEQAVAYEERARAQERARKMRNEAAARSVEMAQQRTLAAAQRVQAARASVDAAQLNLKRVEGLANEGLASTRELELAQLKLAETETELNAKLASLREAEAAENAAFAEQLRVDAEAMSSVSSAWADAKKAAADIAKVEIERAKLDVTIARQQAQRITSPVDGTVVWLHHQRGGGVAKAGERLALIVPLDVKQAVELFLDGNDAPLVRSDRKVRLQFEGWPAVQFSGWPQVSIGTFGGRVLFADPMLRPDGRLRVVVVPDEDDMPWPARETLPLSAKARGWVLLDEVSVGYELWRQLNGFPATVAPPLAPGEVEQGFPAQKPAPKEKS
ncbi:MAG: HlyD family secretion protein [Myxococcota bacterium]